MGRGAWQAIVHGVTKSWTWWEWLTRHGWCHHRPTLPRKQLWSRSTPCQSPCLGESQVCFKSNLSDVFLVHIIGFCSSPRPLYLLPGSLLHFSNLSFFSGPHGCQSPSVQLNGIFSGEWMLCKMMLSSLFRGFPCDSAVKNPHGMQEAWVQSRGQEGPLEKGMATHSGFLF